MKKIDTDTAPHNSGCRYPAPHDAPCKDRRWIALGQAAGLSQFGVNLVTLDPGVWSSQRHWHSHEDEFIYVVAGELILVTDDGRELLRAGDSAGFPAGVTNGHHLINESDTPAQFLAIGSRDERDHGAYTDIDMTFLPGRYSGWGGYLKKDGTPYILYRPKEL
jgi:uncharacterized cupin superfamily protein